MAEASEGKGECPRDTGAIHHPVVQPASSQRPVIGPLAPDRYKVQFTMGRSTHDKLRRAQDLLRHVVPNGDPAEIVDRALTLLLRELERQKIAATPRPRQAVKRESIGRRIPAVVRRAVWRRDQGRCAFIGERGRCGATAFLEFHHLVPYARGGPATEDNIQLRCRAHNQYEARRDFPQVCRERSPVSDAPFTFDNQWLMTGL